MSSSGKYNKPQRSTWFMYLFLSIFVIIGGGCLIYAPVKAVKTILFIRSAATTTGTVVDFHASQGSKTTTYAPEVTFNTPDGRLNRFRSQISSSSPDFNIGQQVPVCFDPANPDKAEIKAFMPLWMPVIILSALGIGFSAIGGGMMIAIHRGAREAQRKETALLQGMKEWETDPSWRSGEIRSVTRQEMWFYWLFAVVWNAIGQPTGFICVQEVITKGNKLAAIGLVFPLVGFWLLSVAIRKTLQIRKFGELVLQMDPSPGSLGGEVGGVVELPVPFRAGNSFAVSLSCLHITRHRKGTTQELIWQEEGRAVAARGSGGTRISFRFAVPVQLPPSGDANSSSHQWMVRISADLPGIDLDRSFVIPVVALDNPKASTLSIPLAPDLEPPEGIPVETVSIEQQAGRLVFSYPPRRNLKSGLLVSFFGGWFLFFTYIFIVKAAWTGIVILPIFGLIGLALELYAVWLFGNSLEVIADAVELVVVRRFFGVTVKSARVPVSAIKEVVATRFGAIGSGSSAKLVFSIVARLGDNTKITIGDGIEGRLSAEKIVRIIAQKSGLGVFKRATDDLGKNEHLVIHPVADRKVSTVSIPTGTVLTEADFDRNTQAMQDSRSMTCPKCGVLQPIADTCNACQVIIAKYLQRQAMEDGVVQVRATLPPKVFRQPGLPFIKLSLLLVVCLVGWFAWHAAFAVPKGKYKSESGMYRNEKYRFAITVPSDWKILTVKEAIQCSTIRKDYADQYLFIASPTTPNDCLLVANIAGISLDNFRSVGWGGYVAEIGSRNPVKFSDIREINGLKVHRVGYEVAGFYREDAYFEADKKLIELYFYVPINKETAERVSRIRGLVEINLQRM